MKNMASDHLVFQENVAAYALEALDSEDVAALEAHLRTCDSCQADLEAYRGVREGLLSALPPRAPGASVRGALQRRLAPRLRRPIRGMNWAVSSVTMTVALAALIGLNVLSIVEVRALRQRQIEQEARNVSAQTAMAMLAYPGTQAVEFDQNGVGGSLLVDRQRDLLAVFAWHLAPAQTGKTYQVWLIDAQGNRTSGGFLVSNPEYPYVTAVIKSPAPLAKYKGIGVTMEPSGGSPEPTGPKVFGAEF